MSREDILHNKFELVPYEKYIDLDHVNRYILRVSEDKFDFLKKLFKSGNKESFVLKDNIFIFLMVLNLMLLNLMMILNLLLIKC